MSRTEPNNILNFFRHNNNNNTSNADLLGLSTPPSNQNSHQSSLIDVLGDMYNNSNSTTHNNSKKYVQQSQSQYLNLEKKILMIWLSFRFVFKNNGVLFENDLIQIGVKSEFRQNLGRLGLFYGNKTQVALQVSAVDDDHLW